MASAVDVGSPYATVLGTAVFWAALSHSAVSNVAGHFDAVLSDHRFVLTSCQLAVDDFERGEGTIPLLRVRTRRTCL